MPKPSEYTGPSGFAHLHSHSIYSALDGVATVEEYAQECVKRDWPGMAITEHGHMASVPDFYFTFKNAGLKPVPGCEIYFNDWEPKRKELIKQEIKPKSNVWAAENPLLAYRVRRNRHLTVLCKNQKGLENLLALTTEAYEDGLFGMMTQFNRIWFEKLCKHKEGLIVLSGCLNGPVCHELHFKEIRNRKTDEIIYSRPESENLDAAVAYIKKFKEAFGEDYYMELQMPGIPEIRDDWIFRTLVQLADDFNIKTVITNDSHYLQREDYNIQKIMMATAQGLTVDDPNLFHVNSDEQFFKTRAELWSYFASNAYSDGLDHGVFERSCDNTLEIVDRCEMVELDDTPKFPRINDDAQKLTKMVHKALVDKGFHTCSRIFNIDGRDVTYADQAVIELKRFISKGFASYFLITQDLIMYGKSQGFIFGPRGSAGGSLVCYLLGLHSLDPLKWNLSFDRFLAEARGGYRLNMSMPDPVN